MPDTKKANSQEITQAEVEEQKLQKEYILEAGTVIKTQGKHAIHVITIVGQIEGHYSAQQNQKSTKYEQVIPQIVAIEEDPDVEALLIILNTVGGDVEAGLALAELVAGVTKPTASLVLGGGHSIGIPLSVSAKKSFIVPTATMTVHPVRHSGLMLGVPQTMSYFNEMQNRITSFVAKHSNIKEKRFTELMMYTGQMVLDVGTVLNGTKAVQEGLIDEIGSIGDVLKYLYSEIETSKPKTNSKKTPASTKTTAKRTSSTAKKPTSTTTKKQNGTTKNK